MPEQKLKNFLHQNMSEPPKDFDERVHLHLSRLVTKEEPKVKRASGFVIAFALILTLGMATALAAFNEDVNQLLYRIWPQAAQALKPVNLSCESQGIRMEVVSATLNGSETLVTLTMQDLEGDRVDETMDLFDSAILQLPYDGSGTCMQTGYDPETKTASFAVYMEFDMDERPAESDKVSFRVSRFISNKKTQTVDLTTLIPDGINAAESMPVPTIRGWSGSPASDRHDAAKEKARRMMVLNTNNSLEIPVIDGVTLTGIGIVDGSLHIQIRYADILHTDNHGFLTLSDKSGNSYEEGLRKQEVGSVSWFGENHDSWEEYIFDEYPDDLSQIVLQGEFTTADPAVEGDWYVTFPLSVIRSE